MSDHGVDVWDWQTFTEFDDNTGYRYFRYWNGRDHGDVAEVRFYGYPADGNYTPPTPASLAVEVTEVTVRFDAGDPSGNPDKTKKTVTIGAPGVCASFSTVFAVRLSSCLQTVQYTTSS